MAKRIAFLYVGKRDLAGTQNYAAYTENQIKAFRDKGVEEYVLCTGDYRGYYADATHLNDLSNLMATLTTQIKNWTNQKVWIGTPRIPKPTTTIKKAAYQTHAQSINSYCSGMKSKIDGWMGSTSGFNNYVNGFYLNHEHIMTDINNIQDTRDALGYQINWNPACSEADLRAHPEIEMMALVSSHVKNQMGKQLMWSPYFGTGPTNAETIKSVGYVANRTNIFNYVFIQPVYYFIPANTTFENFQALRYSMKYQAVYNRSLSVVAPKNSSTIIGVQMEVDPNMDSSSQPANKPSYPYRYDCYKKCFENTGIAKRTGVNNEDSHDALPALSSNFGYSKSNCHFSYYLDSADTINGSMLANRIARIFY